MYSPCKFRNQRQRAVQEAKLRIAVIGSPYVGKSAILRQLFLREFVETYVKTDTDFHKKHTGDIEIEIVDCGHLDDKKLRQLVIEKCDAFILVFSLPDMATYDFATSVRDELVRVRGDEVPYILVGNKADLNKRCIPLALADCLCTFDWETVYCEISAKDSGDVVNTFKTLFSLPKFLRTVDQIVLEAKIKAKELYFDKISINFCEIFMLNNDDIDRDIGRNKGVRKFLCF